MSKRLLTIAACVFVAAVAHRAAPGRGAQAHIEGHVFEAGTHDLVPATVMIRDSNGVVLTEFPGHNKGFRCNGSFDKELPAGSVEITVSRGFDYQAVTRRLTLSAGERLSLEFEFHRLTPLHRLGWYAGDNHVHMIHGERKIETTFPYLAVSARAEALDYLSVAQNWKIPDVTPKKLEAVCQQVSVPGFILTWNMEAPKNYWRGDVGHCMGHGWTLGMHGYTADGRDVIKELTAMSAHDYEREKPPVPNFESHELIHQVGGVASYSHPGRWWSGTWGGKNGFPVEHDKFVSNLAQELPFDTVAGPTYDTVDILMQTPEVEANSDAQKLWFMLLNHGYRIAATASSDSTFDREGGAVPGSVRVYTQSQDNPTPLRIAQQMKAGRNFVTSGPLVLFNIGKHQIGDVVRLTSPEHFQAHIRAWASGSSTDGLSRIDLIRNGEVIRERLLDGKARECELSFDLKDGGTSWYIVRVLGPKTDQIAITNPIYFEDPSYKSPEPTQAKVTASIVDEHSKRPLSGMCELIRMCGRRPVGVSKQTFSGGKLQVTVPATYRLRVSVPGYESMMRSIFIDDPDVLAPTLNMHVEQLTSWSTFEQMRSKLQDVRLSFRLKHE